MNVFALPRYAQLAVALKVNEDDRKITFTHCTPASHIHKPFRFAQQRDSLFALSFTQLGTNTPPDAAYILGDVVVLRTKSEFIFVTVFPTVRVHHRIARQPSVVDEFVFALVHVNALLVFRQHFVNDVLLCYATIYYWHEEKLYPFEYVLPHRQPKSDGYVYGVYHNLQNTFCLALLRVDQVAPPLFIYRISVGAFSPAHTVRPELVSSFLRVHTPVEPSLYRRFHVGNDGYIRLSNSVDTVTDRKPVVLMFSWNLIHRAIPSRLASMIAAAVVAHQYQPQQLENVVRCLGNGVFVVRSAPNVVEVFVLTSNSRGKTKDAKEAKGSSSAADRVLLPVDSLTTVVPLTYMVATYYHERYYLSYLQVQGLFMTREIPVGDTRANKRARALRSWDDELNRDMDVVFTHAYAAPAVLLRTAEADCCPAS